MRPARREWQLPSAPSAGSVLERVLATRAALSSRTEAEVTDGSGHDPFLLSDMGRAAAEVAEAVRGGKPLAIYGDYDADGVTATALLVRCLRRAGADPIAYIPSRQAEGYGLNDDALQELGRRGVQLVVTVDCGTTAVEVAEGRPQGMRLVITDHHLPARDPGTGEVTLPRVEALVNPQRPGDAYPFKGLAGVGVAYKLALALEEEGVLPVGTAKQQLPLVALGTVADMMPLAGENRWLVGEGLRLWPDHAPEGLRRLAPVRGESGIPSSSDLAFSLGPRINAAGRMEDASLALACLLADDPEEAAGHCLRLEELNGLRRQALAAALVVARQRAAELADELPALVIGDPGFQAGVVGLVAGRLAEEFGRPAFVYSAGGDEWRGSARGVEGLNVVEVLRAASPQLLRYGGHRGAGGFSLAPAEAGARAFDAAVQEAVRAQLGERAPQRNFKVDAVIHLGECTEQLVEELGGLGPFGTGNPQVLLCAADCTVVRAEPFGRSQDHLKVILRDQRGAGEAVAFNRPQLRRHLPPGRRIDALFELEVDSWGGTRRTRMMLRDLRPARE